MKIKKLLLAVLVLSSLQISAQSKKTRLDYDEENFFRFGIKGGVNVNKINGQSYKNAFKYNYQLGGFLQFNFSSRFGIQPEVNFVQSSAEISNDATEIYDDLFRDGTQKNATLNYLEIPVLLNVNVGSSKHVKLQIGPSYGSLLSQSVNKGILDTLKNNGKIFANGEWAAMGGLWIQLPLINFGARYRVGLTNLNAIDNKETWKSQSIQIFLGLTF